MSHSPHGVGAITGAVLVTDEAIEPWRTESLLAIWAFKPSFTETGSIDMMTFGSILTLTLLVTLWTKASHRTVILTPGGHITLSETGDLKMSSTSRQIVVKYSKVQ